MDTARIRRANLDGTEVKDVVATGLDLPRGIAMDVLVRGIPAISTNGMAALGLLVVVLGVFVMRRLPAARPAGSRGKPGKHVALVNVVMWGALCSAATSA